MIGYGFELDSDGLEELVIWIGNDAGDLAHYAGHIYEAPLEEDLPACTYPITVFVQEVTAGTNTSPIFFRDTHMFRDETEKEAYIYCVLITNDKSSIVKDRRRTTVRVTAGGGGD